mmetsp:Transcript_36061/g.91815  ORF Transcript_36061/g.91815 Transcript_36061/m.91815 type:complete len:202 (+) Transcript_36061:1004-1609(+)
MIEVEGLLRLTHEVARPRCEQSEEVQTSLCHPTANSIHWIAQACALPMPIASEANFLPASDGWDWNQDLAPVFQCLLDLPAEVLLLRSFGTSDGGAACRLCDQHIRPQSQRDFRSTQIVLRDHSEVPCVQGTLAAVFQQNHHRSQHMARIERSDCQTIQNNALMQLHARRPLKACADRRLRVPNPPKLVVPGLHLQVIAAD